jgi:predicted kinase
MLIALSGLPGSGKTAVARMLARRLPAVHVRVDTIEQALLRCGLPAPLGAEGYVVAYGVAADNLRLGHCVVADCVNAAQVSRDAWECVARDCGVAMLPVHLTCSDPDEHRRRVSQRRPDIEGHVLPTWEQVSRLRMEPPPQGAVLVDTSTCTPDSAVEHILRRAKQEAR